MVVVVGSAAVDVVLVVMAAKARERRHDQAEDLLDKALLQASGLQGPFDGLKTGSGADHRSVAGLCKDFAIAQIAEELPCLLWGQAPILAADDVSLPVVHGDIELMLR